MKVDWQLVAKRVKPETFASIQAFRSRQAQLLKTVSELREQATPLDLTHYSQLKNQSVVAEARKSLAAFKPTAYPLKEQSEIIASSRILAVAEAQKTKESVAAELVDLKLTLVNIETARPIMELTVDDVAIAYPELDSIVEKMAKRGQWRVPRYYEKFGEFSIGF